MHVSTPNILTSEVRTVCANSACTGPCGGRREIAVPTATAHPESAAGPGTTASESILASRRNVRARSRELGVLVSCCRFGRGHHRFHAVAQPGFGGGQAVP